MIFRRSVRLSVLGRSQNGPLTRDETPFTMEADDMFGPESECTGVNVAIDDGEIVGFVSWSRGTGYDRSGTIEVDDLIATSPDAARVLWRVLASFEAVTGLVKVSTSGGWTGADPSRLVLPDQSATVVSEEP